MKNDRMQQLIADGEAIDLAGCVRTVDGDYIVENYKDGVDYCDSKRDVWIRSIGQRRSDGQVLASSDWKFYENPDFICIWLR
jgi:hypothetical protein